MNVIFGVPRIGAHHEAAATGRAMRAGPALWYANACNPPAPIDWHALDAHASELGLETAFDHLADAQPESVGVGKLNARQSRDRAVGVLRHAQQQPAAARVGQGTDVVDQAAAMGGVLDIELRFEIKFNGLARAIVAQGLQRRLIQGGQHRCCSGLSNCRSRGLAKSVAWAGPARLASWQGPGWRKPVLSESAGTGSHGVISVLIISNAQVNPRKMP